MAVEEEEEEEEADRLPTGWEQYDAWADGADDDNEDDKDYLFELFGSAAWREERMAAAEAGGEGSSSMIM